MSKQTFKIGKNFIPNILVLSSSAVLALFATLILVAPVTETTSAVDTPNLTDGLSLVTSKTIEANIHPEENGSLNIIKDTIVGSTNSPYGYEIYISANSDTENSIYLNGNPENIETTQKITATTGTYDAPVALDLTNGATWGYAIAGLDNFDASYNIYTPSATAKFAAMPTVDNKQLIRSSSTAVSDDTIDIYYGINADSTLEPGIYKTEILYTALPIIPPSTAKAILGDNGNLNFVYDYSTYTVGETYDDGTGDTEITAIYDVPLNSSSDDRPLWLTVEDEWGSPQANTAITSVNFADSFANFKPTSTAYWFNDLTNLGAFTNFTNLDTSQVTTMSHMFYSIGRNVSDLSLDVTALNTSSVTDISNIFDGIGDYSDSVEINVTGWNTENITDMSFAFNGIGYNNCATSFSVIGLDGWDVSNVEYMTEMFDDAGKDATSWSIGNINGWQTGNVVSMYQMFYGISRKSPLNFDLSGWDVSKVTNMGNMFTNSGYYSSAWSVGDLSDWDISSVTNMGNMFDNAGRNATNFNLTINGWSVHGNLSRMFAYAGGDATNFSLSATGWTIGTGGYNGMFSYTGYNVKDTLSMNLSGWTFTTSGTLAEMFTSVGQNAPTWNLNLNGWNIGPIQTAVGMFRFAGQYSTNWTLSVENWSTGSLQNMQQMFMNAGQNATNWTLLGLDDWNVSNVTDMSSLLYYAGYKATTWTMDNINGWNVDNVTSHDDFINLNENSSNAYIVNNQPNWQPQP